LIFVIDNLAGEVIADIDSVEWRKFVFSHQWRWKSTLVSFTFESLAAKSFALLVHLGKDLQLVITSSEEFVELVVVQLVRLFIVLIIVGLESLGLAISV
jgi:hypothetical protein